MTSFRDPQHRTAKLSPLLSICPKPLRAEFIETYDCPLFLFDTAIRQGELFNPATGEVVLSFPRQTNPCAAYPLHTDSALSRVFSAYLYYLVTQHVLFTKPGSMELASVEAVNYEHSEVHANVECEEGIAEFDIAALRAPLCLRGLPSYYDSVGFIFLDNELYAPRYCHVINLCMANY